MLYTLRVEFMELDPFINQMVMRDHYVITLCKDYDKAQQKAQKYLNTNIPLDCVVGSLEEIRKRSKEEMEASRQFQAQQKAAREQEQTEAIKNGLFPWGKNKGVPITELPAETLEYWYHCVDSEDNVGAQLKQAIEGLNPGWLHLKKIINSANNQYFGNIGEKHAFTATVVESFGFDGYYGWTNVVKMITNDGYRLTYMGKAHSWEKGTKLNITATIKKHDEYQKEKSTHIKNIKEV